MFLLRIHLIFLAHLLKMKSTVIYFRKLLCHRDLANTEGLEECSFALQLVGLETALEDDPSSQPLPSLQYATSDVSRLALAACRNGPPARRSSLAFTHFPTQPFCLPWPQGSDLCTGLNRAQLESRRQDKLDTPSKTAAMQPVSRTC